MKMNTEKLDHRASLLRASGGRTVAYTLAGAFWVWFSDRLLERSVSDLSTLAFLQTLKGLMFVFASALLVHYLVTKHFRLLKRSTEAQLRSEERLHQVFEHAGVGLARMSLDGRYLQVNPYLCELLGYSEEELLGRNFQEVTFADDIPFGLSQMGPLITGDLESSSWEKRYLHKEGHVVYGLLTLSVARDEAGTPEYFICAVEDISERKAVEGALRESRERLTSLVASIPDYIYVTKLSQDGTWEKVYISPHATKLLGYPSQRFQEDWQFWPSLIHPDDLKVANQQLERLSRGESGEVEYRMRHADGRMIWVRDGARVEPSEQEGDYYVYGVVSDITARKKAEMELRTQDNLLQGVANAAQGLLTSCNFGGAMSAALAELGTSANVDRINVIQYHPHPVTGRPAVSQRFRWIRDSLQEKLEEPFVENMEYQPSGFNNWHASLEAGQTVSRLARELPAEERTILEAHKTRSILLAPIFVDNELWGSVSFEDCQEERVWTANEASILMAGGAVIGGATKREQALAELKQSEARHRAILEATPDLMFRMSGEGVYLDFMVKDSKRLPLLPAGADPVGHHFNEFLPPDVAQQRMYAIRRTLETGEMQVAEFEISTPSATRHYESRFVVSGPNEVLTIIRDITEQRQAEETIRYQAYHDPLTGLPNRLLFRDRLAQALPQARRRGSMVAVLHMDLDRFKVINDTLGHRAGDLLLQAVSQRLSLCVREGDTIARLGGDEFGLILFDLEDDQAASKIAQKVMQALSPAFAVGGHDLFVTPSIGISVHPTDGLDADTLTRNAEVAMYRAKEQGRNAYQLYAPAMNATAARRLTLENALRRALEREEFEVYYQPQVQIDTGDICGMEALIRWKHPELGYIAPGQWIGLAEETGLIIPIGEWVLRKACEQNRAWEAAGYDRLRVAVNLSARQFQQEDFSQCVYEILLETGLKPHRLELEITEHTLMQDLDRTASHLRSLKALGIHLSIDDFGTGHSSLNYLKRFEVDTLKIDRSFVRDLHEDANDAAIVRAIIAMAQSLKLRVVAEGVETEEQAIFLRSLYCNDMQGYLFSQPLPADQATAFLESRSPFAVGARSRNGQGRRLALPPTTQPRKR